MQHILKNIYAAPPTKYTHAVGALWTEFDPKTLSRTFLDGPLFTMIPAAILIQALRNDKRTC